MNNCAANSAQPHASIAELLESGYLPGEKGVIITDGSIRFGDVYKLSEKAGVEFSIVRESVDGKSVTKFYSGSAWSSPAPRDGRLIGHTHPNKNAYQKWPSEADINIMNARYYRELAVNPYAQPRPSRIIWGPGDTHNTIFWPTFR
ncbi:hypothetical protein sS8_3605 [Methylocaldum marinum]|uniref:Uncharacterized protein n=1 Tax=Methylocaldum marinum TaxID=1432792 RepID=A0A250KVC7_9GAMM|nr:hypothetical protein sS8_3605 [Methylocaldum marinum]